jgi:hypothetical protein
MIMASVSIHPTSVVAETSDDYPYGFITEEVSWDQREKESHLRYINIHAVPISEKHASIEKFRVNEDGEIAVGFTNGRVDVYSASGDFLWGFSFYNNGSFFTLDWKDSNVLLCLASDYVYEISPQSEVISIVQKSYKDRYTEEYNSDYADELSDNIYYQNGVTYEIRNSTPPPFRYMSDAFSQLRVTDENGNVRILYNVFPWRNLSQIGFVVLFITACPFIVLFIMKTNAKQNPKGKMWD